MPFDDEITQNNTESVISKAKNNNNEIEGDPDEVQDNQEDRSRQPSRDLESQAAESQE